MRRACPVVSRRRPSAVGLCDVGLCERDASDAWQSQACRRSRHPRISHSVCGLSRLFSTAVSSRPSTSRENKPHARCRALRAIVSTALFSSITMRTMALANSRAVGSASSPVTPLTMFSISPPLLHAMTGRAAAMASWAWMPAARASKPPAMINRQRTQLRALSVDRHRLISCRK